MNMLSSQAEGTLTYRDVRGEVRLRCPRCRALADYLPDVNATNTAMQCVNCYWQLCCEQGVWNMLPPERANYFSQFITDYQFIRAAEGRGNANPEYYLRLPSCDLSDRNSNQWKIRARTFRHIEREILPEISVHLRRKQLRILDLGAGNGWMSYRLALQGHKPFAVDLLTNDQDGLGAAVHYKSALTVLFPRFQAEIDSLPFADHEYDLVIFNASFHYSENYERTLAEALRCIGVGGTILISDTPWYRHDHSGEQMLTERHATFRERYGFPSDALKSLEYLTDRRLQQLATCFGIHWQVHQPSYGIRWQMRPLLSKLSGSREPSQFRIYVAKVNS
jgi:SAM-dependent methyltransferase